ncbi:MAG: ribosome biogenesis factor YjgA [Gammaproteobacteria bacterium]
MNEHDFEDDADEDGGEARPSRSAVKREHAAIQALARQLAALGDARLAALPLDDDVRGALATARRLKRQAFERQVRYASGLLAKTDVAAVRAALERLEKPDRESVRAFHEVERWRAALIEGAPGIVDELAARFAAFDRAQAVRLAGEARREAAAGKPPRAARVLFRYLADLAADA